MIHSMTAFSRVQNQVGSILLCWELKSVNHRYLEAAFRLPESVRFLEGNLRGRMRGKTHRGKFECLLKIDAAGEEKQEVVLNEGLIQALLEASKKITENHQIADDFTVSRLLDWPGIVQAKQLVTEKVNTEIEHLFDKALEQLLLNRLKEGEAIKETISSRLKSLTEQISLAEAQARLISSQAKEKLQARLDALKMEVSEQRVEQEIALLLTRLDVMEELDRLKMHVEEVSRALQMDEPVGRRLDFLMQELNREANTLSSKSDSLTLTNCAVEMKVLIEQMREQIQNVE